jgi:hypothetical protein
MGHFRIFLLLLLPISLFAGASPEAVLQTLPKTLGGCTLEEIHKYDQPGLGASAAYKQDGFLCTVYVYDLGKPKIGTSLKDPVLLDAFAGAQAEIKKAVEAGYYSDLEERDSGTANFGKDHQILRARYRLTRLKGADNGQRFLSDIYVFGAQGQIIKLRISASVDKEEEHSKTIEEMVPVIMDAVRGKNTSK